MVSSSTSVDSRSHRFGLRSLISTLVLIPLLLTGMAAGTVFASDSDVNGGGGRYTNSVDNGSLGNLQPTTLPSPSPLTTSSVSPSPAQSQSESTPSNSHEDAKTQSATADSHTVVFDPANGGKAERVTVPDGSLASPPIRNPQRDGYRFDGWAEHDGIMDFHTPVTRDITLKAKWTAVTDWTLSPDHGPASGGTSITVTPPNADSLSFSTLEARDDKLIGVTGDGRLFTWTTNDKIPVQVPSPRSTSGDVRFITGVVGRNGYAALSRDHRIYTWNGSGDTPALLASDSTTYASIAMTPGHLLAVNQDGLICAWTSKGKLTGKAMSLPKQALAVKAVGNADRLLALDSKGQVWTWKPDAVDINQIQPVKVTSRIVQISSVDHGFILLDLTGQISYLDNEQSQPKPLVSSELSAITAISSNVMQATLIDSKGRIWAWKPGEAPICTTDGNQQYMQAAEAADSRITAISRTGDIYRWSLDEQGRPGKPARLDTSTALTLESASMDGQALTFSKNDDAWQAEIPAHKPGQTAITIAGRQDGQPFTRSLNYTVDQPLTREEVQSPTCTVTFNTEGGNPKPADQNVSTPYGRAKRPSPDPARQGYLFDGWFIGEVAYDFSRPVTQNLTLTAKWTFKDPNNTWKINPDKGSQTGGQQTTITPPDIPRRGIRFSQVSEGKEGKDTYLTNFSLALGSDGNAYAWGKNDHGQLGDGTYTDRTTPVMVQKPAGVPADFTYVQVSAGGAHSLALGSDGNVYGWGFNRYGELGDTTRTERNTPGKVPKPVNCPDLPADFTYVQISAGEDDSLAVGSDGNVYAWGWDWDGELGDGMEGGLWLESHRTLKPEGTPTNFAFVQVSAGGAHTLAIGNDGNAYAWGLNEDSQLGDGTDTYTQTKPVMVRTPDRKTYPDVPADFTYVQVSAGDGHTLAIGSDGNVYAWGLNDDGQLGNNSQGYFAGSSVPVRVRDPSSPTDASKGLKATQVYAGSRHSLAVGSDGYAYAWGEDKYGRLGNNSGGSSSVPIHVRNPASPSDASKGLKATQVSAGMYRSLAVGSDGKAYTWGYKAYTWQYDHASGEIIDGATNNWSVPVPVKIKLQLAITGVRFDQTPVSELKPGDGGSVTVTTPAHMPGTVTVSVDYTVLGGPQQPDTSLKYTYLAAGVLPKAGGEGILLVLATGMTSVGGVLASRRHRRETRLLSHASHE